VSGAPSARAWLRLGLAVSLVAIAGTVTAVKGEARRDATGCPQLQLDPTYADSVNRVLGAREDVWGNALIQSPEGPTYEGVQRYLHPLMLVGRPAGRRPRLLTDSGVYYLAFGQPGGVDGARTAQLHVADGSQIVSGTVSGPRLSVAVGPAGDERYGSCLQRLAPPALAEGYLPVLQTGYVDAEGARYRQESFAARMPQAGSLVSFLRLVINPRESRVGRAQIRITPSVRGLEQVGNELREGRRTSLLFSAGGRFDGRSLVYSTRGREPRTIFVAWLVRPTQMRPVKLGRTDYERARRSLIGYWNRRLAVGASIVVPEKRVFDAERNLLIQNMLLSWRYSIGNPYERFSWEMVDVAEIMGDYGFGAFERAILEKSFQDHSRFPNRAAGERMIGAGHYYRRFGDSSFIEEVTPIFRKYLASFDRQLAASGNGLLGKERYGADIGTPIYGLHGQALVLHGLRSMSAAWALTDHPFLAHKAERQARTLETGLRQAVRSSATQLPDGSLFVPIALLDGEEQPYDALTDSRLGSYWNLVMPYALGTGFFPAGSPEATGILRYMLNHGSRLLGLVRFRAHSGAGNPGFRAPGSDDVYGINVVRFLADNDQPDQLALSLYGKLGAGMTPGTFVSGEGSTIGPVEGEYYRSMYRPPNSANNAFFLEALRLMLVHETKAANGAPTGLQLAYSTPRSWLRAGRRIVVRRAQTSFGPLSFSLRPRAGSVRVHLDLPSRVPPGAVKLRLRLPAGERIAGVASAGHAFHRFDPGSETIDLSGLAGRVDLVVRLA
jgi:hypothetical protein